MAAATPEPVAVAILAKAPIPGSVKTRLIPALGADGAAALQAKLIGRAIATALAARVGPVTLWTTPAEAHPDFVTIASIHHFALAPQSDGDLGARMLAASAAAGGPTIVIGTDCPALMPSHLQEAARHLRDGLDAVVIPAEDGGYVLIGTRRPQPVLFDGMTWGTDTVMAETRRRLAWLALAWREPVLLWDVDRPEDLERLRKEGFGDLLTTVKDDLPGPA